MKIFFERALKNIVNHGDTDIFPFPIENRIFFDEIDKVKTLLLDIDANFQERLVQYPPANQNALVPITYTGFRWATQIDPIWNAYFLGVVLSITDKIEGARISKQDGVVFSYRLEWDDANASIFDRAFNWRSFMERSLKLATQHQYVVTCDISEFYPRLNHHRLENALKQLNCPGDQPFKIMEFLQNFSDTYSFGIPVGGPASRILSELLLDQIDRLLTAERIKFCRFADDYHLFSDSYEQAFQALHFLSEKLVRNQGLQLQKAKTRILTGQEFIATSPIKMTSEDSTSVKAAEAPSDEKSRSTKSAPVLNKI